MDREKKKFLHDIAVAVAAIDEHLEGKRDFALYLERKTVRRAVERELGIIGEAVSRLLKLDPVFPIRDARKIVDFRNAMIHGYDTIDDRIVWTVVCLNLPILKEDVDELLNQSASSPPG